MRDLLSSISGIFFFVLFMLAQFPGGTIFMAMRCNSHDLNGWDWVLSVVIPFYGLISGLSC